jgi:hypothetical protein
MRHRPVCVFAGVAILAFLVGCGNDKTAPTSTPTPSPTSAPTPAPFVPVPSGLSATVQQMLGTLPSYLVSVLAENVALLPNNPQSQVYIQAKITALKQPSLNGDIVNGRQWSEGTAQGPLGGAVPVATVFMVESMRAEAEDAIRVVENTLPVLEDFMGVRFPTANVRIWYGFKIGSTGGGGQIYIEDRPTYLTRQKTGKPYDPILMHELSHSYMLNECLNQFLEFYVANLLATGSVDFDSWTYTTNSLPGVAALFDIYKLIGIDSMRNAYRAVYPLRPPYGSPLSQAVIQAFLSAVPPEHRAVVSAKLALVNF